MAHQTTPKQMAQRLALAGPSGSGKTYTALLLAKALGRRIAVIDTEHGSSTKYAGEADMPDFDVAELDSFSPDRYIEAIHTAEVAGYDVLIIDSLSHAWVGKEGVLEQVDLARARSKTGNAFTEGWRYASPLHNRLIEALLQSALHLIVTMRSKTKYVLEEQHGRQVPKQVGMELVQRDGIEYEWDIVGELDKENTLVITKSRCKALSGTRMAKPGADLGQAIKEWLSAGTPAQSPAAVNPGAPTAATEPNGHQDYTLTQLFALVKSLGFGEAELRQQMAVRGYPHRFNQLGSEHVATLYDFFEGVKHVRAQADAARDADVPFDVPTSPTPPERPIAAAPSEDEARATLLTAIEAALLTYGTDGKRRWKPGAKAQCEQCFSTLKWPAVKRLPVAELQRGYAKLQEILQGRVSTPASAPVEEDVPDFPVPVISQEPTTATPAASNGLQATALNPEQATLKQEALGWGIPEQEIDHTIRRYDLTTSRNLLAQGRELRRKTAATA